MRTNKRKSRGRNRSSFSTLQLFINITTTIYFTLARQCPPLFVWIKLSHHTYFISLAKVAKYPRALQNRELFPYMFLPFPIIGYIFVIQKRGNREKKDVRTMIAKRNEFRVICNTNKPGPFKLFGSLGNMISSFHPTEN